MPEMRAILLVLAGLLPGGLLLAQEQSDSAPDAAAVEETINEVDEGDEGEASAAAASSGAEEDEADEPEIDLDDPAYADLDRQTYEEDDDDFVPTEEIPADQAIPFPTDI